MISIDEALERIFAYADPLGAERLSVPQALGRHLSEDVRAKLDQPPADVSAMDGYAVRAADVKTGVALDLMGTSQAGAGFAGTVEAGQCVRIFTGAPLPAGADAVVMQEKVAPRGTKILFIEQVLPETSVRKRGNDFTKNQRLLQAGDLLTPAGIALASAANTTHVKVHRRPELAVLATGDELVLPGARVGSDQIIASNSPGLSALFAPYCRTVRDYGIAVDEESILRNKLDKALSSNADVVVTTGGASVGDRDLVQPVLKSLGVEIDFWKIAMRPGKPLLFGKKGNTLVFGLPGNPVSAMITAITVVLPALRALSGSRTALGPRLRLPLAGPLPENGPRRHFIRGTVVAKDGGISAVRPIAQTDSAHLSSLSTANALIVHAENGGAHRVGDIVDVIPIGSLMGMS